MNDHLEVCVTGLSSSPRGNRLGARARDVRRAVCWSLREASR